MTAYISIWLSNLGQWPIIRIFSRVRMVSQIDIECYCGPVNPVQVVPEQKIEIVGVSFVLFVAVMQSFIRAKTQ